MLYQRYFIRVNQSNMTHLLGLLIVMCVALGVIQAALSLKPRPFKVKSRSPEFTTIDSIEMISNDFSTTESLISSSPDPAPTPNYVPAVVKNAHDSDMKRKSGLSLLERMRNPNVKTTNYLQKTRAPADEVTHFRERMQKSEQEFRYKTYRNKTGSRGKREIIESVVNELPSSKFTLKQNSTEDEGMATTYHVGIGLTLSGCILTYFGKCLKIE